METVYSKIFITAWNTVIGSFSSRHIISADVSTAKKYPIGNRGIHVIIGIIGDINGQISMSMNAETGKALASEMLGGMEITEVDEMVTSAVGELCNMIMGNACSTISSYETNVDITPPTVVADEIQPLLKIKPIYNITFVIEDLEAIDFIVAVKTTQVIL